MAREPRVTITQDKGDYNREQERIAGQEASKKALESLPEQQILVQHTDIPVGPDPVALKQREDQRKLEKDQADVLYDNAQKSLERAQKNNDLAASRRNDVGGAADMSPVPGGERKDWKDSDFFPVRLLRAYVPMEAYQVVEGQTKRTVVAPTNRTLDKIQADQVIGLPTAEAKKVIGVKIAERADEIR